MIIQPYFLILVPVFFLLKNMNAFFSHIPGSQLVVLFVEYILISCILYLILRLFFAKERYKASLSCLILLFIYFFYNDLDKFKQSQRWMNSVSGYRWSLPVLFLFAGGLIFLVLRLKKTPHKTIGFLNSLLILFCLSEASLLIYKIIVPPPRLLKIQHDHLAFSDQGQERLKHPNIYFLLFDEYQGNEGLQKLFHFDNAKLKRSLLSQGFFVPVLARANYSNTFFSMPSILGMNYLEGTIQGKTPNEDLNISLSGEELIQNNSLIRFLQHIHYKVDNLSPFNLDETGDRVLQYKSITVEKYLIENQTFFHVIKEKIGWTFTNKTLLRLTDPSGYNNQYYNRYIQNRLLAASARKDPNPRFVYSHFFMPHAPFLKDSLGDDAGFHQPGQTTTGIDMNAFYLSYLKYTNGELINMVDGLIKNDPKSIIIIMSDHGYRGMIPRNAALQYDIQFYVRTPEQHYSKWPDTVDGTNAFRILLNNEFDQHLDYLPYKNMESTSANATGP